LRHIAVTCYTQTHAREETIPKLLVTIVIVLSLLAKNICAQTIEMTVALAGVTLGHQG
jgi:hypothetical protein